MRIRTAETLYSADLRHNVRSACIAPRAPTQVTSDLLRWADMIFVMERMHEAFILQKFSDESVNTVLARSLRVTQTTPGKAFGGK